MDINMILGAVLLAVFIVVGIALAVLLFELVKFIKRATTTVNNLDPTLKNVETMTTDAVPAVAKIDPLMDRVQLTVDSLNLEMMRIDQILEDLTEITDAASSATAAVETVTNAPISAVNNVAARVKGAIGSKSASRESVDLADQRGYRYHSGVTFAAYVDDPRRLPEAWRETLPAEEPGRSRHISDFIAGMTDRYAMERYRQIYGKTPAGLSNV